MIVIPNDKLLEIVDRKTSFSDSLKKADEVLQQAVQGITDLINVPALINLDFADVRTVMKDKGIAHIGIGMAKGENKALEAVKLAVESPLLETTISGAANTIINISGDITLFEASEASDYVESLTGEDTNVIFGAKEDKSEADFVKITVIATGLEENDNQQAKSAGMLGGIKYPNPGLSTGVHGTAPFNPGAYTAGNLGSSTQTTSSQSTQSGQVSAPSTPRLQPRSIKVPDFLKRN